MMDNEKIKALVQSYVDELFAHDDMSDQGNIEDKNDALVLCMAFAGHILEKHCIAEKSKVRELHAYWGDCMRRYSPSTRREYRSRQMGVEEIFGKELFNGTVK